MVIFSHSYYYLFQHLKPKKKKLKNNIFINKNLTLIFLTKRLETIKSYYLDFKCRWCKEYDATDVVKVQKFRVFKG